MYHPSIGQLIIQRIMRRMLLFILLLFVARSNAQVHIGARGNALAGAVSAVKDPWSATGNPAGIANERQFSVFLNYSKPFVSTDIARQNGVFIIPFKQLVLALGFLRYGNELYVESEPFIGIAQSFNHFSLGISVSRSSWLIRNYGERAEYNVRAGIQVFDHGRLSVGLSAGKNFGSVETESISISAGLKYANSEKILVAADLSPDYHNKKWVLKTGIEYAIINNFWLLSGVRTFPFSQTFGFAVKRHAVIFRFSFEQNRNLGSIIQLELGYAF